MNAQLAKAVVDAAGFELYSQRYKVQTLIMPEHAHTICVKTEQQAIVHSAARVQCRRGSQPHLKHKGRPGDCWNRRKPIGVFALACRQWGAHLCA